MALTNVCTPGETLRILNQFNLRAKKKFGQNFLIDVNIVQKIIDASQITEKDCVLEIGPGIGSMTGMLADAAKQVVCVEIDETLRPVLAEVLQGRGNVDIIWGDVLRVDLRAAAGKYNGGRPMKVVANLPYYVTTPILMKLLENRGCFESITVMVQKEVAERICAAPGSRDYGAITLAVRYYSEPEIVAAVPPSCFIPRPGVDSSVMCLRARTEPPVQADEKFLFAVIRASFNQRRKTLANGVAGGLAAICGKTVTREQVASALAEVGLPADIRGEKLSLEQFAVLSRTLWKMT
nr:16S rRNA (adenine(1518)-N(6)/adenine(1519)-N(6))-dimethyltransferase RsmA [Lachnoclostridium sp. Marseille-P6806]